MIPPVMVDDAKVLMVGFSKGVLIFLTLIFVLGSIGIGKEGLGHYFGQTTGDLNVRGLLSIPAMAAFLACFWTMRLVFTPEGHHAMFALTWRRRVLKVFYKSPLRRWQDCSIDLESGRPFYSINIRESGHYFPALIRYFTGGYDRVCAYMLQHGRKASIDSKTLAHLQWIAGKTRTP
jgi:hypothetical protein